LPTKVGLGKAIEACLVIAQKWAERRRHILIVEIKAKKELADPVVQAKAKAAQKWVHHANDHAKETYGKPWIYVLIPHDAVKPSATLASLASAYSQAKLI
jgi:type III restriction enzyme